MDEFALSTFAVASAVSVGVIVWLALLNAPLVPRSVLFGIAAALALMTISIYVNEAVRYLAAVPS